MRTSRPGGGVHADDFPGGGKLLGDRKLPDSDRAVNLLLSDGSSLLLDEPHPHPRRDVLRNMGDRGALRAKKAADLAGRFLSLPSSLSLRLLDRRGMSVPDLLTPVRVARASVLRRRRPPRARQAQDEGWTA